MITCNKCDLDVLVQVLVSILVHVLVSILVQVLVLGLVRGGEEEMKPMCVQQLPNNK